MTEERLRLSYKWISYCALMLASLILETTLLSKISVFSCSPSLVPFIVAAISLLEGPVTGATAGLVGGFLTDALLGGHEGFYTVTFSVLALALCFIDRFMYWKSYGTAVINWLILVVLCGIVHSVSLLMSGLGDFSSMLLTVPGEALATAPFTPFLYIIISRIIKSFSSFSGSDD